MHNNEGSAKVCVGSAGDKSVGDSLGLEPGASNISSPQTLSHCAFNFFAVVVRGPTPATLRIKQHDDVENIQPLICLSGGERGGGGLPLNRTSCCVQVETRHLKPHAVCCATPAHYLTSWTTKTG